ncbi:MAG: TIGR01777 family oxidoreductase [Anaerolineae bacterium]
MGDGKRVVITGATGLIGRALARRLQAQDYKIVVFARNPAKAREDLPGAAEYVAWRAEESGPWAKAVDGADAVINLAGSPLIGHRWTDAYKREIRDSRVLGTRGLVNAMQQADVKPRMFINGSAIGYYGATDEVGLTESDPPGQDFLGETCVAWEAEAARAQDIGVRTAIVRTGIVLAKDGGALPLMALPFRLYGGGPIQPGTQWLSWIHIADELGIILQAFADERWQGPINATAPHPLTNRDFSAALGKALHRPSWFPVPKFALNVALGEAAEMLTTGQNVIPAKALSLGYTFKFTEAGDALANALG